jgi:plasmid stabilization system protein ParE
MIYTFVYRPAVKRDVLDAVDYYNKISTDLAQLFLKRVSEAKDLIALNPNAFQIRYKSVRIKMLEQFPYQMHYLIDSERKQIVILAITHAYRRPKEY